MAGVLTHSVHSWSSSLLGKQEKNPTQWKDEGDSDYELILFWIVFLFLYFLFLVVSSSEFEHAYFVSLPSLHLFIFDKQNSNLQKVEPQL